MGGNLIEFSDEDLDKIMEYAEAHGYETVQEAVIGAIEKGE